MRRHLLLPTILVLIFALISALTLAGSFSLAHAQAKPGKVRTTLDVYVIDVEGGNSVLFVAPSGESVLIDTGNVAPGAVRDAERIMAAVKDAGLTQIDHLIITHWHGDHFGGLTELAARIPIKQYIDHGPNMQPNPSVDDFLQTTYPALYAKSKHIVAKPGDKIPMAGIDWRIVTSAGQVIQSPLPGCWKAQSRMRQLQAGRQQRRRPHVHRLHLSNSANSARSTWAI